MSVLLFEPVNGSWSMTSWDRILQIQLADVCRGLRREAVVAGDLLLRETFLFRDTTRLLDHKSVFYVGRGGQQLTSMTFF